MKIATILSLVFSRYTHNIPVGAKDDNSFMKCTIIFLFVHFSLSYPVLCFSGTTCGGPGRFVASIAECCPGVIGIPRSDISAQQIGPAFETFSHRTGSGLCFAW